MKKLRLKFRDEYHESKNVLVERESFVIGRSPDNDLSIPRSELSRHHAEINRFGDVYVISDCNSSNGTTVNGRRLENPVPLENGHRISLGGAFEIEVELIDENAAFHQPAAQEELPAAESFADSPADLAQSSDENENPAETASAAAGVSVSPPPAAPAAAAAGSFPGLFFIIAPLLGLFVLVFAGGLLFLFAGRKDKQPPPSTDDYSYSGKRKTEDKRKTKEDEDETPTPKPKETTGTSETPSKTSADPSSTPTTQPASEFDKIERNAVPFMRGIAANGDSYAFSQKQLGEINNQIKSFKGSSALRENLKAVKRDAAKFEELAKTKGLKPQFLATAALAKIGNQSQSPLAMAQTMLPILGELRITLNNEFADDNLLIIAAYDLGEQGKYRALQSTLEALSKQSSEHPRKIRSIWFLREKGKITDAQYSFALKFLAIGTITQNPKDFSVEAEPLTF
jgi:hypothetical protein